jgi:hypothetical protein
MGGFEESNLVVAPFGLHSGVTTPASKERSPGARFCGGKVAPSELACFGTETQG